MRRTRAVVLALLGALSAVAVASPAAALGEPHLQLRYGDTVTPGLSEEILGDWWFPPTNCPNLIRIEIEDRRNEDHFVGRVRPRSPVELGTTRGPHDGFFIASTVEIPTGIAPGPGSLVARQKFEVKLPVIGCISLFKKSGRAPINVAGEEGNDPPVISEVVIPTTVRQGATSTLSWTLSEPCNLTIALSYEHERGKVFPVGNMVSADRPAGPQTFDWDGTLGGEPLPAGNYLALIRCRDSGGSSSAVTIRRFYVGFGE